MSLQTRLRVEGKELFRLTSPALWILLGLPVLYSLLFGCAYSSNILKNVPTVIYDQDQTFASRSVTQAYLDSERYQVVAQVTTQEDLERLLQDNTALVAVSIPPKFAQNIKSGRASEILVTANSSNNMFANAVISSSQELVQTLSVATGQKLLEGSNQLPSVALYAAAPVKLSVRILNNPTTSYTNFMLPGLAANGLQIAILLVAGPLIAREYSRRSFNQAASIPQILLAKLLPCWLGAIVSFLLALGVLVAIFHIPLRGSWSELLLLGSAFSFLVINISFLFSAITSNEVDALQTPLLYIMPGLLFSGLSWPHFSMNDFSRVFSAFMPLTYMAETLRDLLLAGYAPFLVQNICIMFGGGLILSLLTMLLVFLRQKRLQRAIAKEMVI